MSEQINNPGTDGARTEEIQGGASIDNNIEQTSNGEPSNGDSSEPEQSLAPNAYNETVSLEDGSIAVAQSDKEQSNNSESYNDQAGLEEKQDLEKETTKNENVVNETKNESEEESQVDEESSNEESSSDEESAKEDSAEHSNEPTQTEEIPKDHSNDYDATEEETQKDEFIDQPNPANNDESDDEYEPELANDDNNNNDASASVSTNNTSPDLMKYVMGLPFVNHPNFVALDDENKKALIAEYIQNPNDAKFEKYKGKEEDFPISKRPDLTAPMSYEELSEYSEFIKKELEHISAGSLDLFPPDSRLFIGNLPASSVTKQNLWRIFKQYGKVVQILLKGSYGFCQYETAEQCAAAIRNENDVPLYGRNLQLEVSKSLKHKPQGSEASADNSLGNQSSYKQQGTYEYTPLSKKRHLARNEGKQDVRNDHMKRPKYERPVNKYENDHCECQIYVKKAADRNLVGMLAKKLSGSAISRRITDLPPHTSLKSMINNAAYSGVNGVIVVHRDGNLDVQIFQPTEDGGVKFDEYQTVTVDVAVELFVRAQKFKNGGVPTFNRNFNHDNGSFNKNYNNSFGSFGESFIMPSGSRNYQNNYRSQNRSQNSFNYKNSFQNTQADSQQMPHNPPLNANVLQTLSSFDASALQNLLTLVQHVQPGANNFAPQPLFNQSSPPLFTQSSPPPFNQSSPPLFNQSSPPPFNQPPPPLFNQSYPTPPLFNQPPPQFQQFLQRQQQQYSAPPQFSPPPAQLFQAPPQQSFQGTPYQTPQTAQAPVQYNSNTASNSSNTDPNNIQSLMQTLQRLQEN